MFLMNNFIHQTSGRNGVWMPLLGRQVKGQGQQTSQKSSNKRNLQTWRKCCPRNITCRPEMRCVPISNYPEIARRTAYRGIHRGRPSTCII